MIEIRSKIFYDFESYINKYRFEIANSMLGNDSREEKITFGISKKKGHSLTSSCMHMFNRDPDLSDGKVTFKFVINFRFCQMKI